MMKTAFIWCCVLVITLQWCLGSPTNLDILSESNENLDRVDMEVARTLESEDTDRFFPNGVGSTDVDPFIEMGLNTFKSHQRSFKAKTNFREMLNMICNQCSVFNLNKLVFKLQWLVLLSPYSFFLFFVT